jgi:glyoxylase-like metal-dependent hydrolase (beta-lactamase superfamily II)
MARNSRRGFLKSAGIAAASSAVPTPQPAAAAQPSPTPKPYRRTRFAPGSVPQKISDNVYRFEDTCNVYVVRNGTRCVLVDFGSGKILDHLQPLGITQVDWILHTHHHRDQCQGDYKAAERKISIAVPAHERHLFSDAQNFWRNRRIFHLYYVRNDFNTITEDIPVARGLDDYSTFRWGNIDFYVLPTPGHTLGSISLLATVDQRRVAFTGDLIYAPGKIVNLYDTQVNYGGSEGIDLGIFSLSRLRELKPEMLLPSHGAPMQGPDTAIHETVTRLTDYYRFQTGNAPSEEGLPKAVSPHLVSHYTTTSSFYAIISNSGKAMFIDYGSASPIHFANFERATAATDRIRFQEHSIDRLKRDYALKTVDVAMPSHMHDDHMNGFPHLIRHHNSKVWCYENMVDVFENPRGYNLGCILGEPFKVAKSFRDGEKFRWEEFEFEVKHSPGHTEYQMALFVTIDGKKVAFTGDAFFPNPRNDGTLRHSLIFRNHVENDSHLKSIRNLIEREPETICPGHGQPYPVDRSILLATEQKFRRQQQFFVDMLPEGETDMGLDPSWVRLYPYQMVIAPGETREISIYVRNYRQAPMKAEVALVGPGEWTISPEVLTINVPPGANLTKTVKVSIPRDWHPPGPRFAIAADVVCDGRYLGQITEAVVEMKGMLV